MTCPSCIAANVAIEATMVMGMTVQNGKSSENHPSSLEDGQVVTDEGKANVMGTAMKSRNPVNLFTVV